jgi:hypothetical protein
MAAKEESPRVQTALIFLHVFTTLDTTPLQTILSPSYTHTFGPASLGHIAKPFDKAGLIAHIDSITFFMTSFPVTPVETIDSESSNAVWIWTDTDAQFKPEATGGEEWEYKGQNLFMLWFDGEGRIERCSEIVDSKKTMEEIWPMFGKAKANLEKLGAK